MKEVSQATIEKYRDAVVEIINLIKNNNFEATVFMRRKKLPTTFMMACKNLGYFYTTGGGRSTVYVAMKEVKDIHPIDGRKIAEYLSNYNKNLAKNKRVKSIFDRVTDEVIFEELRKRGYRGVMEKTCKVEFKI